MAFNDGQKAELAAPLNRDHVAQRQQGGGKVSYIEGWHAIAEANRIFGFDGWTREMIELRQLGEPRMTGDKCRVEYLARVRVTAGGVIRDGCGFGQGIDKDVGQAHESALKEAETDAMKRALMTFGNPCGLALYDKSQSNVANMPAPAISEAQWAELVTLMDTTASDTTAFCRHYGIGSLRELPAAAFNDARSKLQSKLKKEAA